MAVVVILPDSETLARAVATAVPVERAGGGGYGGVSVSLFRGVPPPDAPISCLVSPLLQKRCHGDLHTILE